MTKKTLHNKDLALDFVSRLIRRCRVIPQFLRYTLRCLRKTAVSTLLFLVVALVVYAVCAKGFAFIWGRMALSWAHAFVLAVLYAVVSIGFELSPLSSVAIGSTSASTLLLVPIVPAVGSWYLRGKLKLKNGESAGVGARIGITLTPLLLVALVGVVLVLIQGSNK